MDNFLIEGDNITFFMLEKDFPTILKLDNLYISGTFNGWSPFNESGDQSLWKMEKRGDGFTLTKPLGTVAAVGNTGFPEYRFYTIFKGVPFPLNNSLRFSNILLGNYVIYSKLQEKDLLRIKAFPAVKSLSDFFLYCPACRSDLSNIRLVPATKSLFRGYNPFKMSKRESDTEELRLEFVDRFLRDYHIKSDITLNGLEKADESIGEYPSDIINKIEHEGNRLCIDIDYNLVYYHSDSDDFFSSMEMIIRFIISHPGPFYIHCRLGSDRTGVSCAVLSLLCGGEWHAVAHDYERTSNMGVAEVRENPLLAQSLRLMLGVTPFIPLFPLKRNPFPFPLEELCPRVKSVFLSRTSLTESDLNLLSATLKKKPPRPASAFLNFNQKHSH